MPSSSSSPPSTTGSSSTESSVHSLPSYSEHHTQSVDAGSKKDVDWKDHFDLNHENEQEELVDCEC